MAERATLTCDEFVDAAAAVALNAADADEVQRVEDHARMCPSCRAWLDEFRTTAAALGAGVPQVEAPAALRVSILEAVEREPRRLGLLRRVWGQPATSTGRPRSSFAWLVAAASLIVAIASLGWVAVLQGEINDMRTSAQVASDRAARFDRVVNVLASDRLSVKPLQPAPAVAAASTGYVFLDPNSGTGMLMCHDLPPIEQGHAYQIWFTRGNDRLSAGMLWPDRAGDGYTMINVPKDLQSFESIGLTDEPGSGSQWPTTARVIGAPLN